MTSRVQKITIEVKTIDIDKTLDLVYSGNKDDKIKLKRELERLVPPN